MRRSALPPVRRPVPTARPALRVTVLAGLGLAGGGLAACSSPEPARCVERGTGRVVAEGNCPAPGSGVAASDEFGGPADTARARAGGIGVPGLFAWYYGGRVLNGLVAGGGWAPRPGARYRSPSGMHAFRAPGTRSGAVGGAAVGRGPVSRGGFGATGAGRAGGG